MRIYCAVVSLTLLASIAASGQTASSVASRGGGKGKSRAAVTEGYLTAADGVRLFYRKVGSGKDAAVYLHGGPGANFRGQDTYIEPLARGRTVIMYDQRGSGLSEVVTDPKLLTAEHLVRDLEALRQHFGLERMSLVALSWGSALAAMYAAEHPERVERLLLVSPMAPTEAHDDQRTEKLNSLLDKSLIERRRELRRRLTSADDKETVAICKELIEITFRYQYVARPTPGKLRQAARRCDIPAAAIRNRYVVEAAVFDARGPLAHWDFRPMLSRFRMPVLVLEGTETNVPLEATREWAASIPTARLLLIRGAGHELFLDQPDAFRRAAEQFLQGRFPKGAEVIRKHAGP